jgi:hypothetical protein
MTQMRIIIGIVGAVLVASGSSGRGQIASSTTLAVAGRANAAPWIAVHGRRVAVAWGATTTAGKTDVFLAMSRDGGATFGAPVQVNAHAGDARLGGELPPRVALSGHGRTGEPAVVVLWNARETATSIKLTRSTDGGKTFSAAVTLQKDGAAGDRGWPALALDGQGTAHAVWLDHRGLASDGAGPAKHDHRQATEHDGVAMAQKSGLFYASVGRSENPPLPPTSFVTGGSQDPPLPPAPFVTGGSQDPSLPPAPFVTGGSQDPPLPPASLCNRRVSRPVSASGALRNRRV